MRRLLACTVLALALAPAAVAQERPGTVDIIIRLDALEDEIRSLRGQLEEQRHRTRQLEEELRRLQGGRGLAAPAPAAPGGPGDPALGGDGTRSGSNPATSRAEAAPAPGGDDFARGMALLQAGRYTEARAAFDAFVSASPDAPRAPEAAFWSAETLFVEGEHEAAAAAFAGNYRAFGADAPRAADSLLKVAMSLARMGDDARACQTLDELTRRHGDTLPRSLEAAVRRERERAGCG